MPTDLAPEEIDRLRAEALREIEGCGAADDLERWRVRWLGDDGILKAELRRLGALPPAERKPFGRAVNEAKEALGEAWKDRSRKLAAAALEAELSGPRLDVTLPGRRAFRGRLHPVTRARLDIAEIFARMGFEVAEGPEIETDRHNFELLNIPQGHPAREMQDTFYLDPASLPGAPAGEGPALLRTHTSSVQIRTLLGRAPPVRIICPGKVYRRDSDATHTPMFHQVECLHLDRGLSFAHLRGTLDRFIEAFFERGMRTRFRPSYFPFTEPSAEVDISCVHCGGEGGACRVCKGTGWLEVLGAGMVHPQVLANVGVDPEEWSGYAFGAGIDRLAMLKYRLDDLRALFENDARLLRQL